MVHHGKMFTFEREEDRQVVGGCWVCLCVKNIHAKGQTIDPWVSLSCVLFFVRANGFLSFHTTQKNPSEVWCEHMGLGWACKSKIFVVLCLSMLCACTFIQTLKKQWKKGGWSTCNFNLHRMWSHTGSVRTSLMCWPICLHRFFFSFVCCVSRWLKPGVACQQSWSPKRQRWSLRNDYECVSVHTISKGVVIRDCRSTCVLWALWYSTTVELQKWRKHIIVRD